MRSITPPRAWLPSIGTRPRSFSRWRCSSGFWPSRSSIDRRSASTSASPRSSSSAWPIASIGIGIALAFPFLLVFAFLFASADAVFSSAITNPFDFRNWSIGELIGRVLVAATFAWVAGGLFLLAGRGADTTMSPLLPRLRGLLSSTAGATTLLAVDALFVFFVALQIAYLFGGIDTLNATGLTYSTYARRGFFELIAVAMLAGGLLFAVELVVAKRTRLYVAG